LVMTFESIALGAERISVPENDTVMISAETKRGNIKRKANKTSNFKRMHSPLKIN
jgi:hypothetical protein